MLYMPTFLKLFVIEIFSSKKYQLQVRISGNKLAIHTSNHCLLLIPRIFVFLKQIMCDPQKLDRVGSGMQNCIHESILVKVITRCKSVVQLNQSVSKFTVHVHVFCISCSHVWLDICTPTLGKSLYVALHATEICKYC